MIRETRVPAIPDIRDDNILDVLRSIKATIEVREGAIGDPLDQGATFRDLASLNLASTSSSMQTETGKTLPITTVVPPLPSGYDPATDYTTPPAPTGLVAKGGLTNVYLSWDGAPYKNHQYTEVWRSSSDNLGTAVLIGTTAANVYADPAQEDSTYYYWIRFVSMANTTGPYNATSGTMAKTALRVSSAIAALSTELLNSQLYIDLGTRITSLESGDYIPDAIKGELTSIRADLSDQIAKNGSAILHTNTVNAKQATSITALGTRVGTAESSIVSLQSTTSTQATSITSLTTRVGTSETNITNLQTTTSNQATSISNLSSTVGGHTTSISTLTSTTNGLSGQYTVKIDNNGHVTGFGLASTVVNGTPTSAFIVRADKFAIAGASDTSNPLGTTSPASVPFMVNTTSVTVNGKTYPSGTWIDTAFIANATIDNAKISDLTADKITTGSLTASIGISTGKITGGVNTAFAFGSTNFGTGFFLGLDSTAYKFFVGSPTQNMQWNGTSLTVTGNINAVSGSFRNINIYNASDQIIFSSGGVTAQGLANAGLGSLAYKSSVAASTDVSGLGAYAFLAKLSTANISTYIDVGAIGSAYIGSLDAAKITSGTIDAARISATTINSKVSSIDAAVITSGTIANARIGDLYAKKIYCGNSANAVDFVDATYTNVPMRSHASGFLGFSGDTGVSVYVPATCYDYGGGAYDCSYYTTSGASIITGDTVKFKCVTSGWTLNQTVRTGVVQFFIVATATVDHYFTIWYRLNGGSWVALGVAIEQAGGYGTTALQYSGAVNLNSGDVIEFGMSATNTLLQFWNTGARNIDYGALSVWAVNF